MASLSQLVLHFVFLNDFRSGCLIKTKSNIHLKCCKQYIYFEWTMIRSLRMLKYVINIHMKYFRRIDKYGTNIESLAS